MPESTQLETRKRRSHWQVLAAKKLRYADFLGGDGPHVVLSKCGRRWRYWLHDHWHDALTHRLELDRQHCGPDCLGKHSDWALRDE